MLILHEGGFTSIAHEELIKSIKRSINGGKKVFLIVPEQQTVTAEGEMCDILEPSAALNFEVTNFTRFTNTAFRALGGISGEYVTSAKRALIMWGTLTELSPALSMTRGRGNVNSGLVTRALGAINELGSLGIKPHDLAAIEEKLGEGDARLKSKLRDLSMIYALYKDKLSEKFSDMTEDIGNLAKKLRENPAYLADTEFYIEGFTSFTEPQYELISAIMSLCPTTVSLAIKKSAKDSFEYTELVNTERRLIGIADRSKIDKKLLKPDAYNLKFEPVISEISDLLWRTDGKIDNDSIQKIVNNSEIIRIFEANTPFDECDFVAADIKRRVMQGESFSSFAVIARSLDSYCGIIDSAFAKAGIPLFMAKRDSITSFEAIKMIMTAYSIIERGFRVGDVITYAKCGLSGITREECDLFEIYVSKWKIDGSRFTDGMIWNMNPDGYSKMREGAAEKLIRINDIRSRLIDPLTRFADSSKNARTVREQADSLLDFLLDINLESRLKERARELLALGEDDAAARNMRLWEIICNSLDTVVETLCDTPADGESFMNQLSVIFADTAIGSIPSNLDEVNAGSADMARFVGKKHVYLLGVNRGEFPMTVNDNSYFTDRDKAALEKLGLAISPDLEIKNAREFYCFSRSFTFASESVTLLYTKKTASLGAAMPAEVIERISEITDKAVKPEVISDMPISETVFSPETALEMLGSLEESEKAGVKRALADTSYKDVLKISEGKIENDDVTVEEKALGVIIGKNIYLSQSKIERFMQCPFRFFSSTYLKLEENEEAEINQLVVGNFIHSVLESIFNKMIKEGRSIHELDALERAKITKEASRRYVTEELGGHGSARNDVIIDRICRVAEPIVDGLCDEFANCRFTPVCCELHIDSFTEDTPNSIVYETSDKSHRIFIDGFIDRLDTYTDGDDVYVRVVDYKTGMKKFSLEDIKNGENLQMLLYLKAAVETDTKAFKQRIGAPDSARLIPAGIVYVKTSVADVTINEPSDDLALEKVKDAFERIGASLDDEKSLSAMNPDYIPSQKARNGTVTPITYSEEEWTRLGEEMKEVIVGATEEITGGRIPAKIKNKASAFTPCRDCQYKYLCRNASE